MPDYVEAEPREIASTERHRRDLGGKDIALFTASVIVAFAFISAPDESYTR
jgi:hypothetical protein